MSYREFRAYAAITMLCHQQAYTNEPPEDAAQSIVAYVDALIAELERTDRGEQAIAPAPEPPGPALPRLNKGWKWALRGVHVYTKFDKWWVADNDTLINSHSGIVGGGFTGDAPYPVATPDWHNPENIESPGEGWRFLVEGEDAQPGDEYFKEWSQKWAVNKDPDAFESEEWTHRTTRPLPPVLAQDKKEGQS